MSSERRRNFLAVIAAALGYFVDAYDLILYNIVRVPSLRGIGVAEEALLGTGVTLLNAQLIGMLAGGVLWGVIGDRRGRRSVLFGSIFSTRPPPSPMG
jgi:putative MFS transporter